MADTRTFQPGDFSLVRKDTAWAIEMGLAGVTWSFLKEMFRERLLPAPCETVVLAARHGPHGPSAAGAVRGAVHSSGE